jgi:hypothetical protein
MVRENVERDGADYDTCDGGGVVRETGFDTCDRTCAKREEEREHS